MKEKMSVVGRRTSLIAVLGVAAVGLVVSPAAGGPNFLTLGEAKKAFFTKKRANTRFLSPAEGNGRYLRRSGVMRLMVSPSSWVAQADDGLIGSVDHYLGFARLGAPGSSIYRFTAGITLPVTLQGRPLRLDSFELCYDAANGRLAEVGLYRSEATAANPTPNSSQALIRDFDRTDSACRTYRPASPLMVDADDMLHVSVGVASSTGAGSVDVSRLSLNLST